MDKLAERCCYNGGAHKAEDWFEKQRKNDTAEMSYNKILEVVDHILTLPLTVKMWF